MQISLRLLTLWVLITYIGCSDSSAQLRRLSDEWLVTGQIGDASFYAKEILALGMDGTRYRTGVQSDYTFALQLPGNAVYALYVIPDPKLNPKPAAVLTFDDGRNMDQSDTLRLPKLKQKAWLDLGSLDIKSGHAWPTKNPLHELDFDEDGLVDFLDNDDQNDGLRDNNQKWDEEKVGICHTDKYTQKFLLVPLATLLTHIQHGDKVGTCKPQKL